MPAILVSACLVGEPTRHDGAAAVCEAPQLARWRAEGRLVPCCPEVEAGCQIPRPPAEIEPGAGGVEVLEGRARIRDRRGTDVTSSYTRGAELALLRARAAGARLAILKDRSPSCGVTCIHDGTFGGRITAGRGVAAVRLERHGIRVFSEGQLEAAEAYLRTLEADAPGPAAP
jgi:uncharacterized protein YbbK (DUF523 family)